MDTNERLMTPGDVATVCAVSPATVRQWHARGRLQPAALTLRGGRLYTRADVERVRAERAQAGKH